MKTSFLLRLLPVALTVSSLSLPTQADEPANDSSIATGVRIIEARFGAFDGWVDVTEQLRAQVRDGGVRLPSLEPVLDDVKDPAFGHHKALVVVYRHQGQVRTKIVATDGVPGAWGSLTLPEYDSTGDPAAPKAVPVYLNEMAPTSVSTFSDAAWGFGGHGYSGGRFHGELERIRVNGKTFEHSLGMHPRPHDGARVIYQLGGRFARFTGQVGITDQDGLSATPLTFEILGDGRSLWKSGPTRKPRQLTGFDVSVLTVDQLQLVVHCPGSNHAAKAVWIEPQLRPATAAERAAIRRTDRFRLRVYFGDPLAEGLGTNRLVLDRDVNVGVPFKLKGEHSLVTAGLLSRPRDGQLHFKGRVVHNGGALEFNAAVQPGIGVRSNGGIAASVIILYYVQFDPLPPTRQQSRLDRLKAFGAVVKTEGGRIISVDLTNSPITDSDLKLVGSLSSLQHLSLNGCRNLTDAGLVHLKPLKQLQSLALERTLITDAGMPHLSGLTELGFLSLNWAPIGSAGLTHLAGMKKLGVLYLCETKVGDEGLIALRGMHDLSWLDLRSTQVTDAGLHNLSGLQKLRLLSLYGIRMTDAGVAPLLKARSLEVLTLNHTQLTDEGLIALTELPKLKDLDVRGTHATKEAVEQVRKTLPECLVKYETPAPKRPLTPEEKRREELLKNIEFGRGVPTPLRIKPAD